MPRTKRRTVKRASEDLSLTVNATMANQPKNIKEILEEFDTEKQNLEQHFSHTFDNFRNKVENAFLMLKLNLDSDLNTNINEYKAFDSKESNGIAITKGFERPSRPVTKSTVNRPTRQKCASTVSTSRTINPGTVIKSRTRSIANDRAPISDQNDSKFKTPVNRPPIPSAATITPKVNMNEPISVMRRPNQGEVALSLTGSPLMVSSVSRDDMATVSVPMANGNILSILPRSGATMDISFNEQTKKELLLLKGNIEGLLKMTNKKS